MRAFIKYHILILILLLIYIYSCKNSKNTNEYTRSLNFKYKKQFSNKDLIDLIVKNEKTKKTQLQKKASKNFNRVSVYIVHGLSLNKDVPESFKGHEIIIERIKKRFPKDILDIKSVSIGSSVNMSIPQQANMLYKKIKKELNTDKLRRYTKIILIGHSAGGLAAYHLYYEHNKEFDIAGIITISTPWKGTTISDSPKKIKFPFKLFISNTSKTYNKKKLGIRDTHYTSLYLKWVKQKLMHSKIPIYAIGGETNYYATLCNIKFINMICIKKRLGPEEFFGTRVHDGLVPLSSQLGEGLPNITSCYIEEPVHHTWGIKKSFENAAEKIVSFFKGLISAETQKELLRIKSEKAITESEQTLKIIYNFIKKYGYDPVVRKNQSLKMA